MSNEYINNAPDAPAAIGPYSQAVAAGGFYFLSGQIPLDPATGTIVEGGIEKQTERVLLNLTGVLKQCGVTFAQVCKTTIFLTDLSHFQVVNGIYERYFGLSKPARSTIQVAALPRGALIEIELIAKQ